MSDDEINEEELHRRMERNLFGRKTNRTTTVETRRRGGKKKPRPTVEISWELIPLERGGDHSYAFTFTSLDGDRRIRLRTALGEDAAREAAREYRVEGRILVWGQREADKEDAALRRSVLGT